MSRKGLSAHNLVTNYLGLSIAFEESDHGVTRESIDSVTRRGPMPQSVATVYLYYPDGDNWGFYTILVSHSRFAYILSGFSWGYSGEGPRGLEWTLQRYGFERPFNMPPAHNPGLWRIDRGYPRVIKLG